MHIRRSTFGAFLLVAVLTTSARQAHAGSSPRSGLRGTITQPLDPFDPNNKGTFQQRYYIDTEYASGPDAPVIYFLSNEGEMYSLIDGAGFMMVMAKALGANFVALEHRYYGQSIPTQFPELTADSMKYLTIRNALADFRAFEHFARRKYRNLRGKWLTLGRSYGASLSIWYRETYPKETVGAIAAAPAINIPKDSTLVDDYVVAVLGPSCVHDFHAKILDAIESLYLRGQSMEGVKAEFGATHILSDADFLSAIGGVSVFLAQMKGPSGFCPVLSAPDSTAAFVQALNGVNGEFGMTMLDWTDQGIMDPKASLYEGGLGMRQWVWQTCFEFGDEEIISSDPTRTIQPTSIANYETQEAQCMKVLGVHFTADPEDGIDAKYFKPLIAPDSKVTDVLIIEDTADPTSALSVPEGQNQNPGVIVYPVEGAAHHQELNAPSANDPQSFKDAREMILNTARSWLR